MGMFTTILGPFGSCQIKTGWDNCDTYKIGDKIPWTPSPYRPGDHIDGVHLGYGDHDSDTLVVIKDCTVAAVLPRWWDKDLDVQIVTLKLSYSLGPPARSLWSEEAWAEKEAHDKEMREKQEKWDHEHAHLSPLEKMAAITGEYVKQKMNEQSLARQILPQIAQVPEEKKYMRLKIVGDGTSANTHIIDEETGRELEMVHSFRIKASISKPFVECFIKLIDVELDLTAQRESV